MTVPGPIVAPCRDNPAIFMRRAPDGCVYTDGPRVARTGLMPLSDMAERDAERRCLALYEHCRGMTWLNYGCGHNAEQDRDLSFEVGWDPATGDPEPEGHFALVTLFHVIEHVDDPVALLRHVRERFTPRVVVVETPNARDWMLDVCEPYRRHWAWTDHRLVLTADALLDTGRKAGLGEGHVRFVQRYSAGNTLRWFVEGKPGGHVVEPWMHLDGAAPFGDRKDTLWCEWRA